MRWLRFGVLVVVIAVAQTSFVRIVWILRPDIWPNFLVILLAFFSIYSDRRDAVITSFAIGFAADLANPGLGFMGPRIISFGLLGTLLSDLNGVLSIRRMPSQAVTIFVLGAATFLLSFVLARFRTELPAVGFARELLWSPLLSGIIGPFLFLPLGWWMRMNVR
jgi:cell shape-determining protein MreD